MRLVCAWGQQDGVCCLHVLEVCVCTLHPPLMRCDCQLDWTQRVWEHGVLQLLLLCWLNRGSPSAAQHSIQRLKDLGPGAMPGLSLYG